MRKKTGKSSKQFSLHLIQGRHKNNRERIHKSTLPTVNEVAAVFAGSSDDGSPPFNRDIKIHCKSRESIQLAIDSGPTDPMTYPLLYPSGEGGGGIGVSKKKK